MHGVIRSYSGPGAKELFDLLIERKDEVEELIRGVPGFVSYTLIQSGDGGATVTVCRDKTGTDESIKRAREWVADHGGALGRVAAACDRRGRGNPLHGVGVGPST